MRTIFATLGMWSVILGPSTFAQAASKHPIDAQLVSLPAGHAVDRWHEGMLLYSPGSLGCGDEEDLLGAAGRSVPRRPTRPSRSPGAWSAFPDKQFELNYQFYLKEMQVTMYHVMATHANMDVVKDRALGLKAMLNMLSEQ